MYLSSSLIISTHEEHVTISFCLSSQSSHCSHSHSIEGQNLIITSKIMGRRHDSKLLLLLSVLKNIVTFVHMQQLPNGQIPAGAYPGTNPYGQGTGSQYPGQMTGQTGGQYPGQYPGQVGTQNSGQYPGQTGGQYPGQTGQQYPAGQYPGQTAAQYPGQIPGQTGNQYPGQYPGQVGQGQYPGQVGQGQYPGQTGTGQYPGQMGMDGGSCPQMILPPYARYLQGPCPNTAGSRCYLTCDPGFDVIGSCFRVCNQGRWSGTKLICGKTTVRCPPLDVSPGLRLVEGCQNMAGFSCEFGCQNGQRPEGQQVIYCTATGQWSGRPPMCSSSMTGGLAPGQVPGQVMLPGQRNIPGQGMGQSGLPQYPGTGVLPNPGLGTGSELLPGQSGQYPNGQLGERPPGTGSERGESRGMCPFMQPPVGGRFEGNSGGQCMATMGSTCRIKCNAGLIMEGPSRITCKQAGWSPARHGICRQELGSGGTGMRE